MRPLDGAWVVLTRPRGRGEALRGALGEAGAAVTEVPLIEIVGTSDAGASLRSSIRGLRPGAWLVLTSQTAVAPVLEASRSGADLAAVRIGAVGAATRSAIERAGLTVALTGDGSGGAALADRLVAAADPGVQVVLAQAEEPAAGLAEALRSAGLEVVEAAAYATAPRSLSPDERHELHVADAVIVASPSASRALASALEGATGPAPAVVAIGETTALEARAVGLESVFVAERPDARGLVNAVIVAWSARPGHA
jgi:uroporphyrinogen-III synthase